MSSLASPLLAGPAAADRRIAGSAVTPGASIGVVQGIQPPVTTHYQPSAATIVNPERGFYHQPGNCDRDPFSPTTLAAYRTKENISLVMCIFYLKEFKQASITQAKLDWFDQQANAVRAAGLKMVVRFAYTESDSVDAPVATVLRHLEQLAPNLRRNSDVIAIIQSGFVGRWGEGWYTTNFGDQGNVTQTDQVNRQAVIKKVLSVMPTTRMVQVRTPITKMKMYGPNPTTAAQLQAEIARVGHHNDCFLASYGSEGYQNVVVEQEYVSNDTKYVAMGGETCAPNGVRTACANSLAEMSRFRYSYLNTDWNPTVLNGWVTGGCKPQMDRQLGYRLSLASATFPASVSRGSAVTLQMSVRNEGWAAPFNPRPVALVLRNTLTNVKYRLPMVSNPRRWLTGTTNVTETIQIPTTLPAGTYSMLLSLPDPTTALSGRAEYAIQLANSGTWEPSSGLNSLQRTVKVL